MNEFEQDLRSLRRSGPSAELDARIEAALAAAERTAPSRSRFGPWVWWCGATGGLAAAAVAVVVTRPVTVVAPGPDTAVYRLDTPAPMRALLLEPARTRPAPPRVFVSVSASAP